MRNHKLRALGLAVLGALSMMAIFAAGAQAQAFLINEANAGALKATVTGAQEGTGQLLVKQRGINIKCTGFTVNSGLIESTTHGQGEITFEGCKVFNHNGDGALAVCTVHSSGAANEIIKASALLLPVLHGGGNYVRAEHTKTGEVLNPFTTIEVLGASCAARGTYATKGSVVAEVTAATNNTVTPLINLSETIQKLLGDVLSFGAFEAFINGSATLSLTGTHAGMKLGVV